MTGNIHPSAIVHDDAVLAGSVTVGPYCVIGADVRIGADTKLHAHVVVEGPCEIGEDNEIHPFVTLGGAPQDKKYDAEPTKLKIGDRNTIRECTTINRGTIQDAGITVVGCDNWIMSYVHIAHDCMVGDNVILANNATLAGHVHVGDWAIFGGFSGAHQFCRIGPHSFMGMYAGVGKDVPAYVMVMGTPAEPRGVNVEGLKRRGFDREQIRNIRDGYKLLYRSQLRLEEAREAIAERAAEQPELVPLLESITDSSRSIVR
ncbi:MAG: acyl-ACP--UDP-N-acetylglucosamine O-acyltransferase [Pseudomonadota bacterium]